MVRPDTAAVPVHLVPCPRLPSLPAPYRGVPGLLQHVRAGRLYKRKRHAAAGSAHVLRLRKLCCHSQSIHLPRQEYPGPRSYDAMLRGGQHTTHHPLSLPYSTGPSWMGRGHEARRRQRQPPLRAQPVDVALWPGAGAQGHGAAGHGGSGEDSSRGANEGRRDGQAPAASL